MCHRCPKNGPKTAKMVDFWVFLHQPDSNGSATVLSLGDKRLPPTSSTATRLLTVVGILQRHMSWLSMSMYVDYPDTRLLVLNTELYSPAPPLSLPPLTSAQQMAPSAALRMPPPLHSESSAAATISLIARRAPVDDVGRLPGKGVLGLEWSRTENLVWSWGGCCARGLGA